MSLDDEIREHEDKATIYGSESAGFGDERDPAALAGVYAVKALRLEIREARRTMSASARLIAESLDGLRNAVLDSRDHSP